MKTVLCVPGHDEKKVKKCREYGADLILFDLKDSVPEGMKDRARKIVAAHIQPGDNIRVNGPINECIDDFGVIVGKNCGGVWVPKAQRWGQVLGGNVILIETPAMLMNLMQLSFTEPVEQPVRSKSALNWQGLAFGAADFAAYMHVPPSNPQVQYARQQVALAAAALGVPAYDSPYLNLRPDSIGQLRDDVYAALELGYQWKVVVHPAQIPIVQNVRHESLSDKLLVNDYDRERGDDAVVIVDGQLVAPPMIRAARKRLEDSK